MRLRLDGQGQILVSCKQHLNIWLLFCRHWESGEGLGAGELHSQVCG